jgi:hypothetical protein
MIGQAVSAFDPLVAKLQADVGQFLATKQRLLTARMLPLSTDQRAAVESAYAEQTRLEQQMPAAMAAVQRLQGGQLSFGDSITVTTFITQLELHLRRADQALAGLPATPTTTVDWGKVLLWGGGAVVAFYLVKGSGSTMLWVGAGVGVYLLWRNWSATP